jgi:uracil-DNA glycosylase
MPVEGVMILGHDFHSKAAFDKSFAKGGELAIDAAGLAHSSVPSWSNLTEMLRDFGIPPQRCFFTNAYMGLRLNDKTTGRFPGANDEGFVERCRAFFCRQLEAQQPRLILALGAWVPRFLAPMADRLSDWRGLGTLTAIDAIEQAVRHAVVFAHASALPCSVVCLTHPSLRGANVGRREFRSMYGEAAESAMLAESIRISGVDLRVV